jgi:rhodanese-related sulfurtransferase
MSLLLGKKHCIFYKNNTMNLAQEDWVSQFEADENAVILDVRTEGEFNEGSIMLLISIFIWVRFCNRNRVIRQNQELLRVLSFWNAEVQKARNHELGFENAIT